MVIIADAPLVESPHNKHVCIPATTPRLPSNPDVSSVAEPCTVTGDSILVRDGEYADRGGRWLKVTFAPAYVEGTNPPSQTVRLSMSYLFPSSSEPVPFNSLLEFRENMCVEMRLNSKGKLKRYLNLVELKHFVPICPVREDPRTQVRTSQPPLFRCTPLGLGIHQKSNSVLAA